MKDRESYKKARVRRSNIRDRVLAVAASLNAYDVNDEQELRHIEKLLDLIDPILETPFKG